MKVEERAVQGRLTEKLRIIIWFDFLKVEQEERRSSCEEMSMVKNMKI